MTDESLWTKVHYARNIRAVLMQKSMPVWIPNDQIEINKSINYELLLADDNQSKNNQFINNQPVRITAGPFEGVRGKYIKKNHIEAYVFGTLQLVRIPEQLLEKA